MILVNKQLKANKEYKMHREMFPRLYYQNFSGEWSQIRHISIEIINGNIDVQTDLNDTNVIYKYVTEWIDWFDCIILFVCDINIFHFSNKLVRFKGRFQGFFLVILFDNELGICWMKGYKIQVFHSVILLIFNVMLQPFPDCP